MTVLERRQTPRVPVNTLQAHVTSLGLDVNVRDLSFGGFLAESPIALASGVEHEFQFTSDDPDRPATFRARAVYCRRGPVDRSPIFSVGFAFVGTDDPPTLWRIRQFLQAITGS